MLPKLNNQNKTILLNLQISPNDLDCIDGKYFSQGHGSDEYLKDDEFKTFKSRLLENSEHFNISRAIDNDGSYIEFVRDDIKIPAKWFIWSKNPLLKHWDFSECKDHFVFAVNSDLELTLLLNEATEIGYSVINIDIIQRKVHMVLKNTREF